MQSPSPNRTTLKARLSKAHEAAKAAIVKRIQPIVQHLRERHDQLVDVVRDERIKGEQNVDRHKAKVEDLRDSMKQRAEQDKARFQELRSRQRDAVHGLEDTTNDWVRGMTDEMRNLASDIEDVRKDVGSKTKKMESRGRVAWKIRQAKAASIAAVLDNVARLETLDVREMAEEQCEAFGERDSDDDVHTPEVEVVDPETEWLTEHDIRSDGYYAPPPSPSVDP